VPIYFDLPPRELFWQAVLHCREYAPFATRIQSSDRVRQTRYGWAALECQQRCYLVSYIAVGRDAELYVVFRNNTAQTVSGPPRSLAQWAGTRAELRALAVAYGDPDCPSRMLGPAVFAHAQLRQLYLGLIGYLAPEPGPEPGPELYVAPPILNLTRRAPRVRPRS
jgi:hypothetical protein